MIEIETFYGYAVNILGLLVNHAFWISVSQEAYRANFLISNAWLYLTLDKVFTPWIIIQLTPLLRIEIFSHK